MPNLHTAQSPLAASLVAKMRDISLTPSQFRNTLSQLTLLLVRDAVDSTLMHHTKIMTWQGELECEAVAEDKLVFVPILRAGLPMLEAVGDVFENAHSGFLAMKRDEETLKPRLLYDRIEDVAQKTVFLLDPMVATGGSLQDAVDFVRRKNPARIICLNLIAYEKTMQALAKNNPDIDFFCAKIDPVLDENGFIRPGIGDAGDRAFNTL